MIKNCFYCSKLFKIIHNNDILCNDCIKNYKPNKNEFYVITDKYIKEQLERLKNQNKIEEMYKIYLTLSDEYKKKFNELINN